MADPNGYIKCFAKIVNVHCNHLSTCNSQVTKLEALFHAFEVISHSHMGKSKVDVFREFLDQKVVESIENGKTGVGRLAGVFQRIQYKLQGAQLANMKVAYHPERRMVPVAKMLRSIDGPLSRTKLWEAGLLAMHAGSSGAWYQPATRSEAE